MLIILPLPLLLAKLLPLAEDKNSSIAIPLVANTTTPNQFNNISGDKLSRLATWLMWICLTIAASRPIWIGQPVSQPHNGRDLMLAVDISGSMQEKDMIVNSKTTSRIEVLKSVVSEFIERRIGDRIGLILFGTNAYTYVPLTFDRETLNELLLDASIGLAGRGTAIGDAIGLAVKRLRDRDANEKVLILITDGSNTSGSTNPIEAANAAFQEGMTIYTIGVGNDVQTMRRLYGTAVIKPGTALDETALVQIANITEGQYFRAKDVNSLEKIYAQLDKLVPIESQQRTYRPQNDLFYIPLLIGLALYLLLLVVQIYRRLNAKNEPDYGT